MLPGHRQRLQSIEADQFEIGQNQVGRGVLDGFCKRIFSLQAFGDKGNPSQAKLPLDQFGIVRRVFQQQDERLLLHASVA